MTRSAIVLMIVVVCATAALAAALPSDLSGTWTGVTVVQRDENAVTLKLKANGLKYTGSMSDAQGLIVSKSISNVKVVGTTLSFSVIVNNANGTFPAQITLKAKGNTMAGQWATGAGDSAPILLTRQK
jgi:hypothetical protein